MKQSTRKTGIDISGSVPRGVRPCLFYKTIEDWIETAKEQAHKIAISKIYYTPSYLQKAAAVNPSHLHISVRGKPRLNAIVLSRKRERGKAALVNHTHQYIGVGVKVWRFTNLNSVMKTTGFRFLIFTRLT